MPVDYLGEEGYPRTTSMCDVRYSASRAQLDHLLTYHDDGECDCPVCRSGRGGSQRDVLMPANGGGKQGRSGPVMLPREHAIPLTCGFAALRSKHAVAGTRGGLWRIMPGQKGRVLTT